MINLISQYGSHNKLILLVASMLLVAVVVLAGCSPLTPLAPEPTPTPAPVPTPTPEPQPAPGKVLISDSFNLAPFDEEALESKYGDSDINSLLPFNDCGLYLNKFFCRADEVLVIIIRSDQPISIELCDGFPEGITSEIITVDGAMSSDWYRSCELQRLNDNWELNIIFNSGISTFLFISFRNDSGKNSWCQYTISLE